MEKIGSILECLAGGDSVDLYEGGSKDSYLQRDDCQSMHAFMGARIRVAQKQLGTGAHAKGRYEEESKSWRIATEADGRRTTTYKG